MLSWLDNPKHSWKDYAVSESHAHSIASEYVITERSMEVHLIYDYG
jgi:hypothetical protein